jgi:plastocyanin domain-containing protein
MSKLIKIALAFSLTGAALLLGSRSLAEEPKKPAAAAAETGSKDAARPAMKPRVVQIAVTEKGYEPSPIKVKKDEPLELVVTRKTEKTCAKEIVIDEENVNLELPLNTPVKVAFTPKKSGTIKYGCAMGKMFAGQLLVE